MAKKRVAWITASPFVDTDIYIIPYLCDDFEISWFITKRTREKLDYEKEIQKLDDRFSDKRLKIEVVSIGERSRSRQTLSGYIALLSRIKKERYDLVYAVHADMPFFIPLLAKELSKKRTILAIHNVTVPKGAANEKLTRLYNGFALRHFKYFHVFSLSQYETITQQVHGKKVLYAPFVLKDYGVPKKKRTDNRVTFLNFGNIRDYKRIDVLIDAAQKAYEDTGIQLRVLLAGRCDDWEKYQNRIVYPELFDIRLGRVENKDIPDLFNEADYFVTPYQDIAQSGSLIVGINYEKPIIASRLPAFAEYVQDGVNGYFIDPADVLSLAGVIAGILKNQNKDYASLRESQRILKKEKFSPVVIAGKYREFLNEVIRNA